MIVALIAGAAHVANAATLILLTPGAALAEYLSSSAIYSMAIWINLWVLPSAWGYRVDAISKVRQGQLALAVATSLALIVAHPTPVGLAFVILLFLDTAIFYSGPLLYHSDTRRTQMIDLSRACFATFSLGVTFLIFAGSPAAYAWCLVVATVGLATILLLTGWHRPPPFSVTAEPWAAVGRDFHRAFREPRLRALLGARLVEITSLLALAHFLQLGALIALKISLAVAQALCTNARRYSTTVLMITAITIYSGGIVVIMFTNEYFSRFAPATLQLITVRSAIFVLPIMILYFWLVLSGIRENSESVAPRERSSE